MRRTGLDEGTIRRGAGWYVRLRGRSIATSIRLPAQSRPALGPFRQADAVGDPVTDDPDDPETVADQRGSPPRRAPNPPAAKKIVQGSAPPAHPKRLEPVARYRGADEK